MQKASAILFVLCFCGAAFAQSSPALADLACRWQAKLTAARQGVSDSYTVPFELQIEHTPAGLRAALLNGSNRIEFSSIMQQGREVTLRLDQYDATLTAHCTTAGELPGCRALSGEYVRQKGSSASRMSFEGGCTRLPPEPAPAGPMVPAVAISGDWQFTFTDASGKPATESSVPARFTQTANHVEGTIAPVSGDYGLLSGTISGGKNASLQLSRFDGIHALRLDGHFVSPDRIEGVFHVMPGEALSFVAERTVTSAGFQEAEQLTTVENPSEVFRFHGTDASGVTISQDAPRFRGKVVLLDIFGTWCPNCHDEAPVLQSLYAQFHDRGLEVVGLSYEYVDDRARSQRLIDVYRRKYAIGFPLLLAGTTDEGQIAKTLPQLRNFGAYPTTIFLDRHGRVRLIHAGFSGPATGRLDEVKQHFEHTIVQLLNEQ